MISRQKTASVHLKPMELPGRSTQDVLVFSLRSKNNCLSLYPICVNTIYDIQCTNDMVEREASPLVPSFELKPTTAQVQIVCRFMKHIGLTPRMATHTAQKHFQETEESSRDFIAMM
jgi:hypothetical protein